VIIKMKKPGSSGLFHFIKDDEDERHFI